MKPPEGQLEIDVEVHAHLTGTVDGRPHRTARPAERPSPADQAVDGFSQGALPGTNPEGRFRISEKLGPKLRLQTEYYLRQLDERGTDWLLDDEARQWLDDLAIVRAQYRDVENEWFDAGDGGTEDARYAQVIERIVRERAKPAYEGEPVKALDELFDPHCLVIDELGDEPESAAETDNGREEAEKQASARQVARTTRKRAKVAVARARVFDRHPEWRAELAARFS